MTVPVQRQGTLSGRAIAEEGTFDSDTGITTSFLRPLAAEATFIAEQELLEIDLYTGDRTPNQMLWGMINAKGQIRVNFDFLTAGRDIKIFFGGGNYSRPGAGATTLHRFTNSAGSTTGPGSCQVEGQFTESTSQYQRHRGVRYDGLSWKQDLKGAVKYGITPMGIGDLVLTTLVASPTNDGFTAADYFIGVAFVNGIQLAGFPDFSLDLTNT